MNPTTEEVLVEKIVSLKKELADTQFRLQESEKNRLRILKDADRLDTYYKPKIAARIHYDAKRDLWILDNDEHKFFENPRAIIDAANNGKYY